MTLPRKAQVSVADTPYYHIVSRCVRRTFLCGYDQQTQTSYEHRRLWIEERIRLLATIFCIEICAYSVMSNHYHIVLKLTPEESDSWDRDDVIQRWRCLFKEPLLVKQYLANQPLNEVQQQTLESIVEEWRRRLNDLGWFMKCLNEPIARRANKEDECTGHFWESRYKSQALPNEEALLSCMAYVDLNPIRAGMAKTPESSEHTSIRERLQPQINLRTAIRTRTQQALVKRRLSLKPLLPFSGDTNDTQKIGLPISFSNYLHLIDWTSRIVRHDKQGAINSDIPNILDRLNIDSDTWLRNSTAFEMNYQKQFRRLRKNVA